MKTFMVKYIKDNELKIAYVQGNSQVEAQEKFLKDFSLEKDNIIEIQNIKGVKNNYKTASTIVQIVNALGILTVLAGIIILLFAMTNGKEAFIFALPFGGGIIGGGLLTIMATQLTLTNIDTANYTREMFEESRYKK